MNPELKEAILERMGLGWSQDKISSELSTAGYTEESIKSIFDELKTESVNSSLATTVSNNETNPGNTTTTAFPGYFWFFKEGFALDKKIQGVRFRFFSGALLVGFLIILPLVAMLILMFGGAILGELTNSYLEMVNNFLIYLVLVVLPTLFFFLRMIFTIIYSTLNRSKNLKYSEYKSDFKNRNVAVFKLILLNFLFNVSYLFIIFVLQSEIVIPFAILLSQLLLFMLMFVPFFLVQGRTVWESITSSANLVTMNLGKVFIYSLLLVGATLIFSLIMSIPIIGIFIVIYLFLIIIYSTTLFFEYLYKNTAFKNKI